ncbi:hypothetical protein DFH11DRAFT_1584649 [Phellopilus nigrolimitatus]|nr:hypothetical protein DFH11DRAFT_1584649 [Phellopilus nigrolimitatus]
MSSSTNVPALDDTFGALYLGAVLWGVGSIQLYYYFNKYFNDQLWLKIHVFLVWGLDTAHQALVLHSVYVYLITEYGNVAYTGHLEKTLLDSTLLNAFICAQVQAIFLIRIWLLSKKSIIVTATVATFVIGQFTITVAYYGRAYRFTQLEELTAILPLTHAIDSLTALADVSIAGVLVVLLQRSRTGFRRSETMISRLTVFTINTGLITAVCAILSLVTSLVLPNTLIYILFYLCIPRLYVNSLLASLNYRKSMNTGVYDDSSNGVNSIPLAHLNTNSGNVQHMSLNPRVVNISVNTETMTDGYDPKRKTQSEGGASELDLEALTTKNEHTV